MAHAHEEEQIIHANMQTRMGSHVTPLQGSQCHRRGVSTTYRIRLYRKLPNIVGNDTSNGNGGAHRTCRERS